MTATEKHYTIYEIAELWTISPEKVRRLFQDAPGVLKIGDRAPLTKRKTRPHVMLRIPQSVLERFHEERSGGFRAKVQLRRG
jgi:hypothetical protein